MALNPFFPHRCGRNYWDVWDWPQSIFGQHFGQDLLDFDDWPLSRRVGGSRGQQLARQSGESQVSNTSDQFSVRLDCSHFKPEEIEVKTIGNSVSVRGKHEERSDSHGWIEREFTRRYALPEGCDAETVVSHLDSKGVLKVEAPKKPLPQIKDNERVVPIAISSDAK
ncbi:unnamed protein product [Medioppia subpectinata]|uniref:SHSP domain-containing protein n=1 Tax=Medioppia subpectinata TaxID=1979941 RepID=A0A7R9LC57_9ACAR|nr:unnamed protein product [Medioppia subpectinata]CAG2117611.1 unnamed protein product [Medioppia subpectinata]